MLEIIDDLKSSDPAIRNLAATSLIDLVEQAKTTIIEQIQKPENRKYRGTLVYALTHVQCTEHFSILFEVLLDSGFEVAMHTFGIFEKQHFALTDEEKSAAHVMYEKYLERVQSSEYDFEEERDARIQEVIGWYVE